MIRRETWVIVALVTLSCAGRNDSGKIPPSPVVTKVVCVRPARTWVVQSDTTWVGIFNFPQADYVKIPPGNAAFLGNTTVPVDNADNANDVCATVTKGSVASPQPGPGGHYGLSGSILQPVPGTVTLTLQPDGISQTDSTGIGITICVPSCN